MAYISDKLTARFRDGGKQRRPLREQAKQIRQSAPFDDGVKSIDQLISTGHDPLHAAYVSTQNFAAFFAEQISLLDELTPFYRIVGAAEDEYLPEGPPMSPLTRSYFTMWTLFDLRFGPDNETIGTCLLDTGGDLGMTEMMLTLTRLLQTTRMGIYEQTGHNGSSVQLKELITGNQCDCRVPAGYLGAQGELWYVRLAPPVATGCHVALTTPYILTGATRADWIAYLSKQLLEAGDRQAALHDLLKYGPDLNYWNEFVFQAYHHHQKEAIFLAGLADVKGSLPHASPPLDPWPRLRASTPGSVTACSLTVERDRRAGVASDEANVGKVLDHVIHDMIAAPRRRGFGGSGDNPVATCVRMEPLP